jgi:hypothetical protein
LETIFVYAINFTSNTQSLDVFFHSGNSAADLILSEGTPSNWDLTSYEIPGIISSSRINQTTDNGLRLSDYL